MAQITGEPRNSTSLGESYLDEAESVDDRSETLFVLAGDEEIEIGFAAESLREVLVALPMDVVDVCRIERVEQRRCDPYLVHVGLPPTLEAQGPSDGGVGLLMVVALPEEERALTTAAGAVVAMPYRYGRSFRRSLTPPPEIEPAE